MIFFIIIFNSFLFPSYKNDITEIVNINKVNYFTLIDSNIYTIYDEFSENKIYVKKELSNKKIIKSLENFNILYFSNLDSNLYLKSINGIYSYNIKSEVLTKILDSVNANFENKNDFIKLISKNDSNFYLINNSLYSETSKLDDDVSDIIINNNKILYLSSAQGNLLLKDIYSNTLLRLEAGDNNLLCNFNNNLTFLNKYSDRFLINILNENFQITKFFWINTKNNITCFDNKIYYYDYIDFSFKTIGSEISTLFEYKGDFEEFKVAKNRIYVKGSSTLKIYDFDGALLGDFKFNSRILDFQIQNNKLYVLANNNLSIYEIKNNNFWYLETFYEDYLTYLIYLILIIYLLKLWLKYREKQIIFHTIFDLSSTGIIIHINDKGELTNLNQNARKTLLLPDSVQLGEFYKKYIKQESLIELNEIISKALQIKSNFKQKILIKDENEMIDLMCNISPIQNFAGRFKGILISAIDISEELESKRMSNWAQLAHDMQTNLSTIKLNVEQLNLSDETNINRQNKIIHQTNLIIKRVRDIVTVGRSNNLNKSTHSTEEIYLDLIHEFDLDSHLNIKVSQSIEKFTFICDKEKIIRALRNAFENAIKIFDNKEGTIEVIFKRDSRNVYLIIKDSGQGMNEETIKKMKDPYFTTKGEKGGSGIGTIIMQKVMEQHGGEFIIESKLNVGTEVIFKIPYIKN